MRLASAAVAATLSLGGCSSSSPQSVPAPLGGVPSAAAPAPVQAASASSAPPLVPSSLYAALFEEGRVFKLRIETTDSRWDDAASKNVTRKIPSTATCRVTERQVRAWGLASQIACEGGPSGTLVYPIGGRWAATPKGLYHLDQVTDLSSGATRPAPAPSPGRGAGRAASRAATSLPWCPEAVVASGARSYAQANASRRAMVSSRRAPTETT